MTLGLYYYNSAKDIDNCFNWAPTDDQWWITGFTGQNPAYLNPKLDRMVMVSSVNLSGHTEMYEALKNKDANMPEKEKAEKKLDLVFDDSTHTVWIDWYTGVSDEQTTR